MILRIFIQNKNYIAILALVVIGFVIYANTFNNQMFWDDNDNILNNVFVHNFKIGKFFSENLIAGAGLLSNYWRPLLLTVFSLQWQIWGDSVFGYHLINTLAHILTAIALFYFLKKLFKHPLLAFLTSIIFLVHPLQSEAVTYVSGLGDPLSSLFIVLGLICYLKFRDEQTTLTNSWYYFTSLGMYVLALLTKDSAVVMPILVALVDFFYLPQALSFKQKIKTIALAVWPFFALLGLYSLLRATTLNFQNTFNLYDEKNLFTGNFFTRLFTFLAILTGYFSLLFYPHNLHFEKEISLSHSLLSSTETIIGVVIISVLAILTLTQYKKTPIISFGILWFLFRLFPHSNLLVPTSGLMHEHWLYLPMVGIFLIIIYCLLKYLGQKLAITVVSIVVIVFSIQTINRNQDWQNPIRFYNQTLQYSPNNYRVINNLGMSYADADLHEQAAETYVRAIKLDPNNAVAYHNLGNTYLKLGETNLALDHFYKAIELQPSFIFSYNALIKYFQNLGDEQKVNEIYTAWDKANNTTKEAQ